MRQQFPTLTALGMPAAESNLYAALVAHPHTTATELAEQAGLTAQQVAPAMSRLVSAGLASRTAGQPARYLAAAPDVALTGLIIQREQEISAARAAIQRLAEIHRETSRFTHPAELVEVVTGAEAINSRVNQVQSSAREQVRGFDKPPYLSPPGANNTPEDQRLADGVRYRVIYDREAFAMPGRLDADILPSRANGEQARVKSELPIKLILVDDRYAVIPVTAGSHDVDAAYVIHPSTLLDAISRLFEAEWDSAVPIDGVTAPGVDDALSGAKRGRPPHAGALLPLLASGQTDAGIARALGWSQRTTQRRVQQLMAALGATTRFQAGLAASARGWI